MLFRGVSIDFSTENDMQYESIGAFWDLCSSIYGRESLRGLGYNWTKNKIEYVIGLKNNEDMDYSKIKSVYKDAEYKQVLLPDNGWSRHNTYTDKLDEFYGEIYKGGPLTYEIETFNDDGSCLISITRDLPELKVLLEEDLDDVLSLYRQAIGRTGCVWDEEYPNENIISDDIREGCLYGIRDDDGRVVATIARDRDDEVETLGCWNIVPAAELARLTVAREYKNQGLARVLIKQIANVLKEKGYTGLHYLVAEDNQPAINSYKALSFDCVGETDMFGHHFLCYEKRI